MIAWNEIAYSVVPGKEKKSSAVDRCSPGNQLGASQSVFNSNGVLHGVVKMVSVHSHTRL